MKSISVRTRTHKLICTRTTTHALSLPLPRALSVTCARTHRGVHPTQSPILLHFGCACKLHSQVEVFLSQIVGSFRVEAVFGNELAVFGTVMLLQLGGLPNFRHSPVCKLFWGVWMLLVHTPHSSAQPVAYPCLACLRATLLFGTFIDRHACPPIYSIRSWSSGPPPSWPPTPTCWRTRRFRPSSG